MRMRRSVSRRWRVFVIPMNQDEMRLNLCNQEHCLYISAKLWAMLIVLSSHHWPLILTNQSNFCSHQCAKISANSHSGNDADACKVIVWYWERRCFKEVQLNGDNKKAHLHLITVPKYFECSLKNVIQWHVHCAHQHLESRGAAANCCGQLSRLHNYWCCLR